MLPLSRPYLGSEELDAIRDVLESGCVAGTCPEVRLFEQEFAEYVGSEYAIATSSCTTALHLACLATGVNKYSVVVVPAYTFPATAFAPAYCGAKVVFADVHEDTYNIDLNTIPDGITPTHIIPVHAFGNPCNMDEIMDYAEDKDVTIIEDAACAVSSIYKGRHSGHTGTIGDVGCYSFYAIKEICTGEGGMLVTDNEHIADYARKLSDFGSCSVNNIKTFHHLGYNYRMSAIQAAIGRVQLRKLRSMRLKRQRIAEVYESFINQYLSSLVRVQRVLSGCRHSYQRYVIRLISSSTDRDKVLRHLEEHGVQAGIGTYDVAAQPIFKVDMPVSKRLYRTAISLPMYPQMDVEDALFVMGVLSDALSEWAR